MILNQRYLVQDPIGKGRTATVYRGRDTSLNRVVAIKVLREAKSHDPFWVTRWECVAKAAKSQVHPNIVRVYDYGKIEGTSFIVMEFVEGMDLRRYLRLHGVLNARQAVSIAHAVALALGEAHRQNIVHRDVKPRNLLITREGSVKLIFSSASASLADERLPEGMTLGTVQYYAPETAQGLPLTSAADVYAVGLVLYEMLTGRPPFDGDTQMVVAMKHLHDAPVPPSQLNPSIPPELEAIILRCLEKDPGRRYPDGSTLARALEGLGKV